MINISNNFSVQPVLFYAILALVLYWSQSITTCLQWEHACLYRNYMRRRLYVAQHFSSNTLSHANIETMKSSLIPPLYLFGGSKCANGKNRCAIDDQWNVLDNWNVIVFSNPKHKNKNKNWEKKHLEIGRFAGANSEYAWFDWISEMMQIVLL